MRRQDTEFDFVCQLHRSSLILFSTFFVLIFIALDALYA